METGSLSCSSIMNKCGRTYHLGCQAVQHSSNSVCAVCSGVQEARPVFVKLNMSAVAIAWHDHLARAYLLNPQFHVMQQTQWQVYGC